MGEPKIDHYTYEAYLEIEKDSLEKVEFWNGQIHFMAGGTINHGVVDTNLAISIGNALNNKNCRVYNADVKLYIQKHNCYFYPDLQIVCGKIETSKKEKEAIINPTVVFEVLSDTTEAVDRGRKFSFYRSIPSLKEYVIIDPRTYLVEVFTKREGNHILQIKTYETLKESMELESLGIQIPLSAIYQDVVFEETAG